VQGIDNLQAQYLAEYPQYGPDMNFVPYVPVTYWAFRLMIGLGMMAALYALIALWAFRGGRTPRSRLFALFNGVIVLFPLFGISAGWIFTEMGRQPWVVFGEQITADGISPLLTPFEVWASMIGFTVLYAVLAVIEVTLLLKYIRAGAPEAPVEDPFGDAQKDEDRQLYFAY
jgi:cytochrome bd ubiquinol oxidase subunit I